MSTENPLCLGLAAAIALFSAVSHADETIWMDAAQPKPVFHAPGTVKVPLNKLLFWTVPVSGERPMTFSAQNLPAGLGINSKTGTITGIVAKETNFVFDVLASNRLGRARATIRFVLGHQTSPTPPMGWNSYDSFGDSVTEAEILANAKYLAEKMLPYGWDTAVVDYGWYDPGAHDNNRKARLGADLAMDDYGRLLPATNRFPSASDKRGFETLAGTVHAMGLRFGIHIMRGIPRNAVKNNLPIENSRFKAADAADTNSVCEWCPDMFGVRADSPAGAAYYDSIFRLYAEWGVDFVKMDDASFPYATNEILAARTSINKLKRPIILSLSPGETPISQAAHVATYANLWRVSGDFWDEWKPLTNMFTLGARWRESIGMGRWADCDMLPLGHLSIGGRSVGADRQTRLSHSEQVTLMTYWALLPSPLMMGGNLPDSDPWTLALLTNPEVIEINQDSLALGASPVNTKGQGLVWSKKLVHTHSMAVGMFNLDDSEQTITLDWSALGIKGSYLVRDLWLRKSLGIMDGKFVATIPAHGAMLIRLTKK